MPSRRGASKSFTIFAIVMVALLVLGSLVVFGGAIFGSDGDDDGQADTVEEQTSELETAVADNPDDPDAAAILANIYANQGKVAEAISLYERATQGRPDDGNLRLSFGIALLRAGNMLDAQVQLERARDLLPGVAGPAYYLGQLEELQDPPDEEAAREWYQVVIEISPDSGLAEQARERLNAIDGAAPEVTPTS
jgi:tetratricopeptide (TPR) repeat protein